MSCTVLNKTQLDGLLKEIERTLHDCNNETDGFDQCLAAEVIEATVRQYQFTPSPMPSSATSSPVELTFNLCGVYDAEDRSISHKVRIRFASQKMADEFEPNSLIGDCMSWLYRHYPSEQIRAKEFDLDCEGEYESADNDDVIIAT